ncbi:MAG TPA: hypothetical protein VLL27_12865 [Solirubrobacterales bacterium]|nr:hypothetical protein [Solirubrobacterales bacterium]
MILLTIDWAAIGSISATCVAIAALALTAFEAREVRKHNRLSVQPLLRIDHDENGIVLRNTGSGTAIVQAFDVFVDDGKIEREGEATRPVMLLAADRIELAALLSRDGEDPQLGATELMREAPIMANEECRLLTVPEPPGEADAREMLARFNRISFEIHYMSLYREVFVYAGRDSPFPGRHEGAAE